MLILFHILKIASLFTIPEKDEKTKKQYLFYGITRINKDFKINSKLVETYGKIDFQFINQKEIFELCNWLLEDILNSEKFLKVNGNCLLAKPDINREDYAKTFRICVLSYIYSKPVDIQRVNLEYLDFFKHLARQLYYPIWKLSFYGIGSLNSLRQNEKDVIFDIFFDNSFVIDKEKKINGLPAVIIKKESMNKFIRVIFDNFDRNKVNLWLKEFSAFEIRREIWQKERNEDKSIFGKVVNLILKHTETDFI